MTIEKIEKLINSNIFGDVYIGLKLFDALGRGDRLKILRRNFEYPDNYSFTWHKVIDNMLDVPDEYSGNYIKGKNYAYCIDTYSIMIDNSRVSKQFIKRKKCPFEVIETWE